jgi:hypothetical protein
MIAGALALGSFGIAASGENKGIIDQAKDQAKNTGDKLQEIASNPADESTAAAARTLLAKAVNDAMGEGRFTNLVDNFAKSDRERIGEFKRPKTDNLDKAIQQFRADFKAKYNQDFEIRPEHFRDALVYAGRDKNSATVSLPELHYDRAADGAKAPLDIKSGDEKKLDDVAKAAAGETKIGTSLKVHLVNEGEAKGFWRINIPNEITAEQLKGNLVKHIQMLNDQKATWPQEADAAYHAAAFHALQALNDSALVSDR